jgi:hypothetical protein
MSGKQFHETRMGATFYEHTVPAIKKALERIANALEKQNELIAKQHGIDYENENMYDEWE